MALFVNPYAFVPHVTTPDRRAPSGHAQMADGRLSGVLDVTVTARTALLIGGFTAEGQQRKQLPRRKDGTVIIPGSGFIGAVRSVHEALVGGCLRILDTEFLPVHRHPASTKETDGLELAVVADVDSAGRALGVLLCDDTMRIPKELLPGSENDLPRTGDQLECRTPKARMNGDALRPGTSDHPDGAVADDITRVRRMAQVTEDCWVLLVTDTNARTVPKPGGKPPKRSPVHYYTGRVSPDSRPRPVADSTWGNYLKTVEGADDLRPASLTAAGAPGGTEPPYGPTGPEYADVWWPPRGETGHSGEPGQAGQQRASKKIGQRLLARAYLHKGQPVWVKVVGGKVTEIRLSRLWRYRGHENVGKRAGDARPCTDPDGLCWSCRIFGSADTEGREDTDTARQRSYRGHVRIGDFLARDTVTPVEWHLAPLASPRPSAGQFYLDNSPVPDAKRIAKKDTRPAATWGSVADHQDTGHDPRPIRGRKFYWHTDTTADPSSNEPSRGKKRQHQSEELSSEVSLIPAGTVFEGRVTFDNLDAADYGSLLAALDPRRLSEADEDGWEDAVIGVGGGKPFGFGSVTVDITEARVGTASQRYLGETGSPAPSQTAAVRAFREQVPQQARANWQALRHALTFGFIDDDKVWYPPGGGAKSAKGDEDYDKSFEFFGHTTGVRLADGYRDLVTLPDAALPPGKQVLDSTAGEHRQPAKGTGQRRGR